MRTRAVSIAVLVLALGCSKREEPAISTYTAAPSAPTAAQTATTATAPETAMTTTSAPEVGSTTPGATARVVLTPDFTSPAGVDPSQAPRLSLDAIEEEIKMGDVVMVDVRQHDSYQVSHAAGAVNIPLDVFPQRITELPKEKYLVTYCT